MDVTIIEIKEDDKVNCIFLEIIEIEKECLKNYLNNKKSIYIIHYPKNINDEKCVCSSFGILNEIKEYESEINYLCSTDDGSSGSPILLLNNKKVIGLHKGTIKGLITI